MKGVGSGKILGRVHVAQMKLGQSFFPISVTVLESNDMEFLLGLDMLKRHQCCIDLSKNVLRIEGHAGHEEIRFLDEGKVQTDTKSLFQGGNNSNNNVKDSTS